MSMESATALIKDVEFALEEIEETVDFLKQVYGITVTYKVEGLEFYKSAKETIKKQHN